MSKERTFPDTAVLVGAAKMRDLLVANANIHDRDSKGRTALFRTCRLGQLEKALILIAAGSDPNALDDKGEAPLQCAARYGHIECVDALLKAGANIDYCPPTSITEYSESALCSAVRKCPEAARLLLANGADPNAATDAMIYPLLTAISCGRSELVQLLLQHKASVTVCDRDGQTALHLAVLEGNAQVVRALINSGANINARDARGETPIYSGVDGEHDALPAIVELLKAEPDLTIPSTVFEMTPLERAIFVGQQKIADILRDAGAPTPRKGTLCDESEKIMITVELTEAELEAMEEEEEDWRYLIDPIDQESLEPTQEEQEWAMETDREVPSLASVYGYSVSKPHCRLLEHAKQPMALIRMAYFARGYLNAPVGRELEDGIMVLGETYESAAERFVGLGLLLRVEGPRAIQLAFTQQELCALAKQNQFKTTGTKSELAERLFSALDTAVFAERLRAHGGYFELTPSGFEHAERFEENKDRLELEKRQEVVEALIQHDLRRAAKGVRTLNLLKDTNRMPTQRETKASSIAHARFIRGCEMPQGLRYAFGSEARYMSIAAAHVLLGTFNDDWHSWDVSLNPPETLQGEPVRLHVFCAALRGRLL
jgi:ankyrin repeat protein